MMTLKIKRTNHAERGFALIITLLLLVLISGLAIGVMYLASTQKQVAGSDSETSVAYYGGEAGMEKMMVDLANLYQAKQIPTTADLKALSSLAPVIPGITFADPNVTNAYSVSAPDNGLGYPLSFYSTVADGTKYGGLYAQIVPVSLSALARRSEGTEARMFRKVEIVLIPVFQFGVFCDADCSYFPGPDFNFAGRVHSNGNLWLAAGGTLTFYDKVSAAGDVIRQQLANTYNTTTGSYGGTVQLPLNSAGGCGVYPAAGGTNCSALGAAEGSVTGGNRNCPAPNCDSSSVTNPSWASGISGSGGRYGSYLLSGATGATKMTLPFVGNGIQPIEIIRRPAAGDTAALTSSRLANEASIRIILDDNPFALSAGGPADPENIPLASVVPGGAVDTSKWANKPPAPIYFATATNANTLIQNGVDKKGNPIYGPDPNWVLPTTTVGVTPQGTDPKGIKVDPYTVAYQTGITPIPDPADGGSGGSTIRYSKAQGEYLETKGATGVNNATDWPLLTGWLRVEYSKSIGTTPIGITTEWLSLGFTRQWNVFPDSEKGIANTVPNNVNAILLLQQQMSPNRGIVGTDAKGNPIYGDVFNKDSSYKGLTSGYDLLPINFYDPREGELRDTNGKTAGSCAVNGLLNTVELDIGNLKRWLSGKTGKSGLSVDSSTYNGYILYFSDRRGGSLDGGYDYLDTTNSTSTIAVGGSPSVNQSSGLPDGVLSNEEDVYQGWIPGNVYPASIGGAAAPGTTLVTPPKYIASGFGLGSTTAINPGVSQRINCATTGAWNVVLAPRHALRLVDGTLNNVPTKPDGSGGFTVASEQPVYVVGNYNASSGVGLPAPAGSKDSAASVIADTVTLLSTSYNDFGSLSTPFSPDTAATSYYRLAIASGKTLTFKQPSGFGQDFGTDGGIHNFLRYVENWGSASLYYEGSMVSLFYSAYGTGTFKCCTTVYSPPTRIYSFDTNFLTPSLLPPGTPTFKDVVDLGFQQDLNP